MLALELTQMAQRVASVDAAIADPGDGSGKISAAARNRYLEAALDEGNPSQPLRALLETLLATAGRSAERRRQRTAAAAPIKRKPRPLPPPSRRLRIYALDPIGGQAPRFASRSTRRRSPCHGTTSRRRPSPLRPGPVGEYLEVVDIDPASNRVYDPVDLNDKMLLAQDGCRRRKAIRKFHQQMVYAVAMTTIGHFERALGRRALWAPHYGQHKGADGDMKSKGYEVPRLRIYPHALRTDNAYYSPDKKALLFGYFPGRQHGRRHDDAGLDGVFLPVQRHHRA